MPIRLHPDIRAQLLDAPFRKIRRGWKHLIEDMAREHGHFGAMAAVGRADRFYLLTTLLRSPHAMHPWIYARCREVEKNPDGFLDLWAREHYKSTIITFAGIIQELLNDPELTVGIFSHTKPVARKFLLQIKRELEDNELLKVLYPDVLYANPTKDSPKWSEEMGLIVRRRTNPKEASIEAHGLVDGQPTGAHFGLLVYDDVVTRESVGTPDQIKKTTEAWSLSDNLGARDARGLIRKWHAGTRYHFADTYSTMLERGSVKPRIYPATHDGTAGGRPVFLTRAAWEQKKRDLIPSVLAAQMLLNPAAGSEAMFSKDWLSYLDVRPATLNVYVLCDPARSQKKSSDYTAIAVIGVDAQWNKYLLDGVYDRLKLHERFQAMVGLRKQWMRAPGVQALLCGYEEYGAQADFDYFELEMQRTGESFEIARLAWPRDGENSKYDRIQRLVPDFRNKRFHLSYVGDETARQRQLREQGADFRVFRPVRRKDYEGELYSLNKVFLDEFLAYPYSTHDDFLDVASRIYDMDVAAPVIVDPTALEPAIYEDGI